MRIGDKIDPALLLRSNPSFTETKEYNVETEVRVHLYRAREIKRIGLKRLLQVAGIVSSAVAGVVLMGANIMAQSELGIYASLAVLALAGGIYLWMASEWETDNLLINAFRADIVDPQRDSERRAEIDRLLEYYREQQPGRTVPPVVRVESVVRAPGRTTIRTAYNDDLPGTAAQWRDLAGLVTRDVAPEPFSLRTAERVGLTREQWNAARDLFIARGWAAWSHPAHPQQGITLRLVGKRALREMADQLPPYELTPMEED